MSIKIANIFQHISLSDIVVHILWKTLPTSATIRARFVFTDDESWWWCRCRVGMYRLAAAVVAVSIQIRRHSVCSVLRSWLVAFLLLSSSSSVIPQSGIPSVCSLLCGADYCLLVRNQQRFIVFSHICPVVDICYGS